MLDYKILCDAHGKQYLETAIGGKALLSLPQLNKGTAFSAEEREIFNLLGKLPAQIETLDTQVIRAYQQYCSFQKELNKNFLLHNILNDNQVLFYKLVKTHLTEMLPTIYTPIVGSAVQAFNRRFAKPRGLYITYENRNQLAKILANRSHPEIDLIVVSDGEGVLGIGDQGIAAMDIAIAKLCVYTLFGGISPLRTLPIVLDVGTNNENLLNDPLYLGWRHPRISGAAYSEFIDEFVSTINQTFPQVFLHWEDLGRENAYQVLERYRYKLCCFNDDIQGTGVVALAAVLSAVAKTQLPYSEHRIVIFGAGSAGMGITNQLFRALVQQGLSEHEARARFWIIDRQGLLTACSSAITAAQRPFCRAAEECEGWGAGSNTISLLQTVTHVKPTILIGCSSSAGAFTEQVVREMAVHVANPIIFPLSNPTDLAEAKPTDLLQWTDGRAFIATGSPFPDTYYEQQLMTISQCNNFLVFPGIGLGTIAVKARHITDQMLMAAASALGAFPKQDSNLILPTIHEAEQASKAIAVAVARAAIQEGIAQDIPEMTLEEAIEKLYWEPQYLPYRKAS